MKVNLGRGFGPLDFDENGRFFSLFPENLPYMDDDFEGDDSDYMVYVDAELVEAVCNAGLDFNQFLVEDVEGRREMLEEAGVDPNQFDLDFDHDVRERLEEEGLLGDYDEDFEDEYDDEYDDEFEDEEDPDEDFDDEDDDYDEDGDDFEDEDDDFEGDDDYPDDDDRNGNSGDTFFGNLR
jgi:hypothetical protein